MSSVGVDVCVQSNVGQMQLVGDGLRCLCSEEHCKRANSFLESKPMAQGHSSEEV